MSTDKSKPPHKHHALLKSSGIVACGVLASRVLGFVRDVILARFLGTGFLAEAFFVAQRIPNLLRDMVGEGAANAAIVPVLSEYAQKRSKEEWQECINAVLAWGVIILGSITVIGIFAAPWIVRLIAPGFAGEPGELQLTVDLTRIMFPYLILIALTAFQAGILYSLNAFFAPAFGPCLLNLAMILSVWVACLFSWPLAYTISVGVLVGGVWQFWAQWVALRRRGVYWKMPLSLNHEGARQIGRLLLPRLMGQCRLSAQCIRGYFLRFAGGDRRGRRHCRDLLCQSHDPVSFGGFWVCAFIGGLAVFVQTCPGRGHGPF